MKTEGNSKSGMTSGLDTLLHQWLTSSRAPTANLSEANLAIAISEVRELIRSNDGLISISNRLKRVGPPSAQNMSVKVLYAAFNFANPPLRSSSSTTGIENTKCIRRSCCYHQSGLCVSYEPILAAPH
jgi:hypothetical protein